MFRHNTLSHTEDAEQCLRRGQIPINPYKMRNGRGIDFTCRANDLLNATIDPGNAGGCLFVILNHDSDINDIMAVLELRNEEYDLYSN